MTDRNFEFFDEWTIRQTDRAYLDARDVRDLDLGHGKIPRKSVADTEFQD